MGKFTHENITIAKKQAQIVRYYLKEHTNALVPTSTQILNMWANCFETHNWQHFIRQVNGYPQESIFGIAFENNYISLSKKLQSLMPQHNIKNIELAVSRSLYSLSCCNG